MDDAVCTANLDYLEALTAEPGEAARRLETVDQRKLEEGARYGDEPIPTHAKPVFISPYQRRAMADASRKVMDALNTFIDRWLQSPTLQDLWQVDDRERALYKVDPGYDGAIQVARFDGFLHGGDVSFLEFNCDSPGGPGYGDVIHRAYEDEMMDLGGFADRYRITRVPHRRHLVAALRSCYRQWRRDRDRPRHPYVALTDWRDVATRPDIDLTVQALQQADVEAAFADPRDLELDGDRLVHDGREVDLVYKRAILSELLETDGADAPLTAYRHGSVCMVNSPRSLIVGTKMVMAGLRLPEVQDALTDDQRRVIDEHVPWTAVLRDEHVEIDDERVDLRDYVLDHQDELVLKPARGYGGRGVHLGSETDEETWAGLVDDHLGDADWVVQERLPIPTGLFPVVEDGQVRLEQMYVNVNPFVFGGTYAGCYTRVSPDRVINVSQGGGVVPTMTVESVRDAP